MENTKSSCKRGVSSDINLGNKKNRKNLFLQLKELGREKKQNPNLVKEKKS